MKRKHAARAKTSAPEMFRPDHASFYFLLAKYRTELQPETPLEDLLVDQIAQFQFRLNRTLDTLSLVHIEAAGASDETKPRIENAPEIIRILRRSARSTELCIEAAKRQLAHCRALRKQNEATGHHTRAGVLTSPPAAPR